MEINVYEKGCAALLTTQPFWKL